MSDILGVGDTKEAVTLAFNFIRWLFNKPVVQGKITRADNVTPVPGVVVYIGEKKEITALDGGFVIEGVGTGQNKIDLELNGERVSNVIQLYVKSRGSEISLKRSIPLPLELEDLLNPSGLEIEGSVFKKGGEPASEVIVRFGDSLETVTARSGKFFVQIPLGVYNISIVHDGVLYRNIDKIRITQETMNIEPIMFQAEGGEPFVVEKSTIQSDNTSENELEMSATSEPQQRKTRTTFYDDIPSFDDDVLEQELIKILSIRKRSSLERFLHFFVFLKLFVDSPKEIITKERYQEAWGENGLPQKDRGLSVSQMFGYKGNGALRQVFKWEWVWSDLKDNYNLRDERYGTILKRVIENPLFSEVFSEYKNRVDNSTV